MHSNLRRQRIPASRELTARLAEDARRSIARRTGWTQEMASSRGELAPRMLETIEPVDPVDPTTPHGARGP